MNIAVELIAQVVCIHPAPCGQASDPHLLKAPNRQRPQVEARQLIWWLALRLNRRANFPLLGRLFKRDGSTVKTMVKKLEANYSYYRATLRACLKTLATLITPNEAFEMYIAVRERENFLTEKATPTALSSIRLAA